MKCGNAKEERKERSEEREERRKRTVQGAFDTAEVHTCMTKDIDLAALFKVIHSGRPVTKKASIENLCASIYYQSHLFLFT